MLARLDAVASGAAPQTGVLVFDPSKLTAKELLCGTLLEGLLLEQIEESDLSVTVPSAALPLLP